MKCRTSLCLGLLLVVVLAIAVLGWEPPPWAGQVRVCRSQFHQSKIAFESGMRVKDAIARSRPDLGEAPDARIVVYRWRSWLPERVPDAAVIWTQQALGALGKYQWSDTLWAWWDGIAPREGDWREVARDGDVGERRVESGEMIVLYATRWSGGDGWKRSKIPD